MFRCLTNSGYLSNFDFSFSFWQSHFLVLLFYVLNWLFFGFLFLWYFFLLRFWLQLVSLWRLVSFLSHSLLFFCMAKGLISEQLFKLEGSLHHTLLYGPLKPFNQLILFFVMLLEIVDFSPSGVSWFSPSCLHFPMHRQQWLVQHYLALRGKIIRSCHLGVWFIRTVNIYH